MSVVERMTHAREEFLKFRIDVPYFRGPQVDFDFMREVGRKTKGQQQFIKAIVGATQGGKSSVVQHWAERVPARPGLPHPVLHVTLLPSATTRSLGIDIMRQLGEFAPPMEVIEDMARRHGRPRLRVNEKAIGPILLHNAIDALDLAGIELLVLDELGHLIRSDKATQTRWDVADAIKVLSIKGVCPIVLVGVPEILPVVSAANNPQLAGRSLPPFFLNPLDITIRGEALTFKRYIAALDNLLVQHGVFPRKSNLNQGEWSACFYDVARGLPGRVSNLVERATYFAMKAERNFIAEEDLSNATRFWAMAQNFADYDPWNHGPRDIKVLKENMKEIWIR